jgi:hypothetical protein
MILWQGAGILALLIPLLVWGLGEKAIQWTLGQTWAQAHPGATGALVCLSGLVIFFFGLKLNRKYAAEEALGGEIDPSPARNQKHTILFIPMAYAGLFWVLAGIYLFFNPVWAFPWLDADIQDGFEKLFWGLSIALLALFSRHIVAIVSALCIGVIVTLMAKSFGFSERVGFIIGLLVFFQISLIDLIRLLKRDRTGNKDDQGE